MAGDKRYGRFSRGIAGIAVGAGFIPALTMKGVIKRPSRGAGSTIFRKMVMDRLPLPWSYGGEVMGQSLRASLKGVRS